MSNPIDAPYRYHRSENGTYWTEGPGHLYARFDEETAAQHFVNCMNEAWWNGRRTGGQDRDIAQAIELEKMK
jgi:hypothetical protein